jgi:hypothetical protein
MNNERSTTQVEAFVAELSKEYPARTPLQITTAVLDAIDESNAVTHQTDIDFVSRSVRVRLDTPHV